MVIAGDFDPTSTGLKPRDLTQSNNLKQIVKFKTRDTGTLDWFLTIYDFVIYGIVRGARLGDG